MSRLADLHRLQDISGLIRDARLETLHRAALARNQTLARLEALKTPPADEGLHPVAADLARVAYEGWADARRRELTRMLARQTAEMAEAEAAAREAFGRSEVLGKLEARLGPRR